MKEEWRQIKEAPDYYISNFGRVLSKKKNYFNRIMKPKKSKKTGYLQIGLMINNKRKFFLIHRLVLSHFNPIENMEMLEVNHIDENKQNNHIENLEWMTSKENCNYGTRNQRLSEQQGIKVQCVETGKIYDNFHIAAQETGTDISSINMCCTGYRNRHTANGYHWRYA